MNNLSQEISNHWEESESGYAWSISSLADTQYPAWTVNLPDGRYGVAVPFSADKVINEAFASVWVQSMTIKNIPAEAVLVLSSFEQSSAFASLCAEFISPGKDGEVRNGLTINPVSWWQEWKGLLGNKNVDKRVYDVLGELVALEVLSRIGYDPTWGGPSGATCDIDCGTDKFEIKSTLSRNSKVVQIHGLFQLSPDGTRKHLILAQFESSANGLSINEMVERLTENGFSRAELNNALLDMGYPRGNSSRDRCYNLISLTKYVVDEGFPHISSESFNEGTLPIGVTSINYGVTLDGIEGESLISYVAGYDGGAI